MFLAYLFQPHGCDYTIACGYKLIELESTEYSAAAAELQRLVVTDYQGEAKLASAILIEAVRQIPMPVDDWYHARKQEQTLQDQLDQEQAERELYEQLKHKFD